MYLQFKDVRALLKGVVLTCHTKIGPAGLILAENFAKNVPPRPLSAKIGPAGPL